MDSSQTFPTPRPGDGWQDYLELKQMLRALGDVVRLNLVHALASGGEVKVTELAVRLGVSQPLVSWNLTVLRRAGLVRTRRQGREVYCSLDMERFARCEQLLGALTAPAPSLESGVAQEPLLPPASHPPRKPEQPARRRPDVGTSRRAPRPSEP
jgi:DNA-binding transcriptional ArsR family regulator